jgi:hypothetical protein
MSDIKEQSLEVLRKHLADAQNAYNYHRFRGCKGDIEAMIARYKVSWLKELIRDFNNSVPHDGR